MKFTTLKHSRFALVLLISIFAACDRTSSGGSNAAAQPGAGEQEGSATEGTGIVARIVFVDQEQACECTQNRITASWTALQAALGEGSGLEIERIHRDTQEAQAEEFRALRPMVTVPGIYLLDEDGALIELLQGDITEEQFRTALDGSGQTEGTSP